MFFLAGCAPLFGEQRWLKASLHVHTAHSDGANSSRTVLQWYADHGYDVVALTDHNRPTPLRALGAPPPGLLVIPGVEFTSEGAGPPVHVSGLYSLANPTGLEAPSPADALEQMIRYFERDGALAIVNHPRYGDALTLADLLQSDVRFLEIFNASSGADPGGGASEALWDGLLRRGRRVYGIAVDDMHALPGGENPNVPGGGFIMLNARRDWLDVRRALTEGRFYASSGPVLRDLRVTSSRLTATPERTGGCHWRLHGNRTAILPAGPLHLDRPRGGYLRAVYDCGGAGKIFLQPLASN